MDIDQSNFLTWKKDEVTKEVFRMLKESREYINLELVDANLIMSDTYRKHSCKLIGKREGIDLILEIMYEDLEEDSNED